MHVACYIAPREDLGVPGNARTLLLERSRFKDITPVALEWLARPKADAGARLPELSTDQIIALLSRAGEHRGMVVELGAAPAAPWLDAIERWLAQPESLAAAGKDFLSRLDQWLKPYHDVFAVSARPPLASELRKLGLTRIAAFYDTPPPGHNLTQRLAAALGGGRHEATCWADAVKVLHDRSAANSPHPLLEVVDFLLNSGRVESARGPQGVAVEALFSGVKQNPQLLQTHGSSPPRVPFLELAVVLDDAGSSLGELAVRVVLTAAQGRARMDHAWWTGLLESLRLARRSDGGRRPADRVDMVVARLARLTGLEPECRKARQSALNVWMNLLRKPSRTVEDRGQFPAPTQR